MSSGTRCLSRNAKTGTPKISHQRALSHKLYYWVRGCKKGRAVVPSHSVTTQKPTFTPPFLGGIACRNAVFRLVERKMSGSPQGVQPAAEHME